MFILLPESSSDPKYSAHTKVLLLIDTKLTQYPGGWGQVLALLSFSLTSHAKNVTLGRAETLSCS